MFDLYTQYARMITEIADKDKEPFYQEYCHYLIALNRIVMGTDEVIEGSLFYDHLIHNLDDVPDPAYRYKRRNFVRYVCTGRRLLEVGFNAGHSALLALTVNKYLTYHAIDIDKYRYTTLAYQYLQDIFGDRIQMLSGDSRDILPMVSRGSFDLMHIDGGHSATVSHADLASMIKIADINSVILFDDSNADYIEPFINFYITAGYLSPEDLMGTWEHKTQVLLRVNKRL
jgi:hypothetical protein